MDNKPSLWAAMKVDRIISRRPKKNKPNTRKDEPPFLKLQTLTSTFSYTYENQQKSYFYFLPYEIRRQILVYAFGGRRLHIDLAYKYPHAKTARNKENGCVGQRNCGIRPKTSESTFDKLRLDLRRRKRWQWWGCVCHRSCPQAQWMWSNAARADALGPWLDKCCDGYGRYCTKGSGDSPTNCQIGIMGFLLSCRQAYHEGIEILYSMNDFATSSGLLLSHIDRLLLPSSLALISSVEISWPLELLSPQNDPSCRKIQEGHFEKLLEPLQQKMKGLKRLYISFSAPEKQFWISRWVSGDEILGHIDQLVANLPKLRECGIALPDSVYEFLVSRLTRKRLEERVWENSKVWRDIHGRMVLANPTMDSTYPEPPVQSLDIATQKSTRGYWVFEGASDGMALLKKTIQQGQFVCGL